MSPVFAGGFFTTSTTWDASLVAPLIKNLPAMWGTQVQSLGWEDPLQKGMATHSIFLPGESHGQSHGTHGQSMDSQRAGHN